MAGLPASLWWRFGHGLGTVQLAHPKMVILWPVIDNDFNNHQTSWILDSGCWSHLSARDTLIVSYKHFTFFDIVSVA